jgi:hypothetical protein
MSIKGGSRLRKAGLIAAIITIAKHKLTGDSAAEIFRNAKNKGRDWRKNGKRMKEILSMSSINESISRKRQELRELMQDEYGYQLTNRAKRIFKRYLRWQDKEAAKVIP